MLQPFQDIIDATPKPSGAANTLGAVNLSWRLTMNSLPDARSGYVYIVWAVGTPRYKIGKSSDPSRRIEELNKQSCYPLKLLESAYFRNCDREERRVHRLLRQWRVHGEWFEFPPKLLKYTSEWLYKRSCTKIAVYPNQDVVFSVGTGRNEQTIEPTALALQLKNIGVDGIRYSSLRLPENIAFPSTREEFSEAIQILGAIAQQPKERWKKTTIHKLRTLIGIAPSTPDQARQFKGELKIARAHVLGSASAAIEGAES